MADYTILLIDYDPRSIHKMQDALEGAGYRVEVAKDGEAGIKAFEELRPDLTLVEAMIPKMHGFEVCRRLKDSDHGKESPVLIVTAVYKGRKYRFEARHHYGSDGYLEKPIGNEELVGAVRSFLPTEETAVASEASPGGELEPRRSSPSSTPSCPTIHPNRRCPARSRRPTPSPRPDPRHAQNHQGLHPRR